MQLGRSRPSGKVSSSIVTFKYLLGNIQTLNQKAREGFTPYYEIRTTESPLERLLVSQRALGRATK